MSEVKVKIRNLHKSYGDLKVIRGIDLDVHEGEVIALVGPSGCGKSTFLRCINKLEDVTGGSIVIEGNTLCEEKDGKVHYVPEQEIRKIVSRTGMVFQQFNLFPHLTVLDNMTLAPIKLNIMTKNEADKKALDILNSIGLRSKQNSYPGELSGGQKQRVAIGRALMMNPDIMLFDEPTSALDPEMVGEVLELIEKLANNGMTMIIVSHEMNFVKKCANKVVFLDAGKVSYFGSVNEVFNNNDNERLVNFLSFSNNFVLGPVVIQPERKDSTTFCISSSEISGGENLIVRFILKISLFFLLF